MIKKLYINYILIMSNFNQLNKFNNKKLFSNQQKNYYNLFHKITIILY